ncbi:hypothetical protein BDD12DRAFT_802278 [Trichophaea hybrida]|nr:hypothetical protein BDD12DRAFT_802278 [Trichophaea hybrida]
MLFGTSLFTVLLASTLVCAIPHDLSERGSVSNLHARIPDALEFPVSSKRTFNNNFAEAAYKNALKKGIDPHGPMPQDYTKKTDKFIKFKGDSDFALWNAAQGANAVRQRKLNKRNNFPYLTTYPSTNCSGEGTLWFGLVPGMGNRADTTLAPAEKSLSIANHAIDPKVDRLWLLTETGFGGGGYLCKDLNYYVYGPIGFCSLTICHLTQRVNLRVEGKF